VLSNAPPAIESPRFAFLLDLAVCLTPLLCPAHQKRCRTRSLVADIQSLANSFDPSIHLAPELMPAFSRIRAWLISIIGLFLS